MEESNDQYDIIGDIHGRWDKLEPLLRRLEYRHNGLCYAHDEGRVAIFLGDLIDPKSDAANGTREVLTTVKAMCDTGNARCVLGNHEYNFVAYHTPDPNGGYLRERTKKNDDMHAGTITAFQHDPSEIERVWIPWMKSLPFFIELNDLRIVHACWHDNYIELLRDKTLADDELLRASARKETEQYLAIETVLKGVELPMPDGQTFPDSQGVERSEFRARWWNKDTPCPTAKSMVFPEKEEFSETPVSAEEMHNLPGYPASERPVFIGHYYKPANSPHTPEATNLCCVDHSAADGGPLIAYRWDGHSAALDGGRLISHDGKNR